MRRLPPESALIVAHANLVDRISNGKKKENVWSPKKKLPKKRLVTYETVTKETVTGEAWAPDEDCCAS